MGNHEIWYISTQQAVKQTIATTHLSNISMLHYRRILNSLSNRHCESVWCSLTRLLNYGYMIDLLNYTHSHQDKESFQFIKESHLPLGITAQKETVCGYAYQQRKMAGCAVPTINIIKIPK